MRKRILGIGLALWAVALMGLIAGIVAVSRSPEEAQSPTGSAVQLSKDQTAPQAQPSQAPQTVPSTQATEPVAQAALVTEPTKAPQVQQTAPAAEAAAPSLPPETIPATEAAIPPTQETTPATEETVPPTQETVPAAQEASFTARTDLALNCWLYTPAQPREQTPLIVYLHGGSGKGDDLELVTQAESLPKFLREDTLGPVDAYVLMPQCPAGATGWPELAGDLFTLIDQVAAECAIDTGRVSLTGHSMGGTGVWNLACAAPERFSRVAPLSGSVRDPRQTAYLLKNTPVWAFVGSADEIVPPQTSQDTVERIRSARGNARITTFDDADHFSVPTLAYLDPRLDLLGWLTE